MCLRSVHSNRTGATRVDATKTATWWSGQRIYSGDFWLWADSLPTAEIAVMMVVYSAGDNIEIRLGPTGAVKTGRQNGVSSASASATLITTGSWFRIS